jgi:hypothetical protein
MTSKSGPLYALNAGVINTSEKEIKKEVIESKK